VDVRGVVPHTTLGSGSTTDKMVMNLDFAETFLDIAGVTAPAEMQGQSIKPILEGQNPANWRKSVYYHYYEFPQPHHVHPHNGVRTDHYKLIHFYTIDAWELFDLEKDPHEMKSVYNDPAYATTVADMKKELKRLMAQYKDDGTTVVKFPNPNPPMPKAKGKGKRK
jgi:arylsulfatase A-like enzyme